MKNFGELKYWQKGLAIGLSIDILLFVFGRLTGPAPYGPAPYLYEFVRDFKMTLAPMPIARLMNYIFPFPIIHIVDFLTLTIYGIIIGAIVDYLFRDRTQSISKSKKTNT